MYTDTTITEVKMSIPIICDEEVITYKITSQSSVFSAETFAIYKALKFTLEKEFRDFTIISDSISVLISLKNISKTLQILRNSYKNALFYTMTRATWIFVYFRSLFHRRLRKNGRSCQASVFVSFLYFHPIHRS